MNKHKKKNSQKWWPTNTQDLQNYKVFFTLLTKLLKLFFYKIHKNMTLIETQNLQKQEFVLLLSLCCFLPNFPWSSLSCKFHKSTSSFYGYISIIPHQNFQAFSSTTATKCNSYNPSSSLFYKFFFVIFHNQILLEAFLINLTNITSNVSTWNMKRENSNPTRDHNFSKVQFDQSVHINKKNKFHFN